MNFDIFNLALKEFEIFILVVTRITAIFLSAPLFGSRNVPTLVKVAIACLIGFIVYPVISHNIVIPQDTMSYSALLLKQVLVGVVIGYSVYMIFAAIQLAGQIIDLQMGFGIVNVIDPMSNMQVSIIGQFQFILGILIFMSIDGHHMMIKAVVDSFNFVPLQGVGVTATTGEKLSDLFMNMFMIAFKIAGPATIALFLTNLTLGLISRTIPQMNVFMVGLPLNIVVGLLAVLISMPIIVNLFNTLLSSMWEDIYYLIKSMRVA